jgi:glycosyltransferase involved in cell wall biosynthesis
MSNPMRRHFGRPLPVRHVDSTHPVQLVFWWFFELLRVLPRLLLLRWRMSIEKLEPRAVPHGHEEAARNELRPRVVLFSDNLDETNGIAMSARLLVRTQRERERPVRLVGTAYHTREGFGLVEHDGTVLLPQVFSMKQVGYDESELAVPSLVEVIRWLERIRPDLVEIETPSAGGTLFLIIAKLLGIPVISHYRTDIFAYVETLANDRPMILYFTKSVVWLFCKASRPVIVPSEDFRTKLRDEMGLREDDMVLLPRGVNLTAFGPHKAAGHWQEWHPAAEATAITGVGTCPASAAIRFLFVGRVSKEKELPFLEEVWRAVLLRDPHVELLITGQGPYLEEMRERTRDLSSVAYSGKQTGDDLASLFAEAHWFLFPSGTDTFGNVIVESLASGVPALVSDSGGPRDIVTEGQTGQILPFRDLARWTEAILQCAAAQRKELAAGRLSPWREACLERAAEYTPERSADAFWAFYREHVGL